MTNLLAIEVAESPAHAPNYNRDSIDMRAATITKAIVVKNGTVEGKTTVDIQFTDAQGAEFVAMITGALLRSLVAVIDGAESH